LKNKDLAFRCLIHLPQGIPHLENALGQINRCADLPNGIYPYKQIKQLLLVWQEKFLLCLPCAHGIAKSFSWSAGSFAAIPSLYAQYFVSWVYLQTASRRGDVHLPLSPACGNAAFH
jgi:hypothetical protein